LYEQGFTINGARHRLESDAVEPRAAARAAVSTATAVAAPPGAALAASVLRRELLEIRRLLGPVSS